MVRAITRRGRSPRWHKWYPAVFVGLGLLGILTCGYGYAAQSTNLLIEGRALIFGQTEVRNTGVRVVSKGDNAFEAYNAEYTSKSVSLYPEITAQNEQITYAIKTCNYSKTKSFELTGLDEPATAIGTLEAKIDKVQAGSSLVLGTILRPGECTEAEVAFTQTAAQDTIGSMTLDYTWQEYNGVPFTIQYMQEMTPEVCNATSTRETKQLIDQRDGHKYWVTKMHDGRCWMTQDLDYDGGGDTRYTRQDVDDLKWSNDKTSSPVQYYYNGDNEKGHDSDGSYYSYMAAMNACPKGWRLATGGVGSEWDKLFDVAELNALGNSGSSSWPEWWERVAEAPFYLRTTGYVDGNKGLRALTTRTGWTSTRSAARLNTSKSVGWGVEYPEQKYHIDWDDSNFYGEPVRCIANTGHETETKELLTIETMQEMTAEICAVSQEGDSKQLVDERDGKKYWVTKLKDGQCWMTQNLDYDGGGTRFDKNSDISKWISETHSNPAQYYYNGDNDIGRKSDGSYYSYKAALNVCPAGWRLPTGGPGGDYDNLFGGNSLGTSATAKRSAILKTPYYFWASGFIDNNGLNKYNEEADYRSARRAGDSALTTMAYTSTVFRPLADDDYYFGESVRCVYGAPAQEPQDLFAVDTMQEVTPQICQNTTVTNENSRRLLVDTRDNHAYWASKLSKDGNCWMVQNLDYDGGGTRFNSSSNLATWIMGGYPEQYYYRGDWQDGLKSYGSLYSWQSAQNVCPMGWRLPTGGPSSEETTLWSGITNSTTGINKLKAAPFYFIASGYVEDTGVLKEGREGYWWSSTKGPTGGYVISYSADAKNKVRPYTDEGACWGESVRCIVPGN